MTRTSTLLACLGCFLSLGNVNQAHGQLSGEVLFGPNQTQLVVRIETTFTVSDTPAFELISSYQSGEPYLWHADFVTVPSSHISSGAPSFVIDFLNGFLEQSMELVIPYSYIRSNVAFGISSEPLSPPDGVGGVQWVFSPVQTIPMSIQGRVEYNAESNIAHVSITFVAGVVPTVTVQIRNLLQFIEQAPGIDDRFEKKLRKSVLNALDAVDAGRMRLAKMYLRAVIKQVERARAGRRDLISAFAAEHIVSTARRLLVTLD